MAWFRHLRAAAALFDPTALAWARVRCPLCGPSVLLRLNAADYGTRCLRCAASAIHWSMGAALRAEVPDLAGRDAYELSARGPLVAYLRRTVRSLAVSEFLPEVPSGSMRDGVRSEDMQQLSFGDACFDLITHTEVLEHVPDDARALAELHRVLRPQGFLLFTVPLSGQARTVERARMRGDTLEHLLTPAYHTDPLRGGAGILAFRDYGRDILDRVRAAGFQQAWLHTPTSPVPWLALREVIVARKGSS